MSLTVNLLSRKEGELKRFLERFYECEVDMDDDTEIWFYEYVRPVEAVDIISAVMDNIDRFQIAICIQLSDGKLYQVTEANHNEIIRDIFLLFCNRDLLHQSCNTLQ